MQTRWAEVEPIWRRAFELAWEGYREGSNPIAAVIADVDGNIVSTGKSAVRGDLSGVLLKRSEIAHAEVNALATLDNRVHGKAAAAGYTLYVTMEPCPLCMSALYMSDVKALHYAARDAYAGSANLLGATPYLARKLRHVHGPVSGLGDVSAFLCVYYDLRHCADDPPLTVHEEFAKAYPLPVAQARALAPKDGLDIEQERDAGVVFDRVCQALWGEAQR